MSLHLPTMFAMLSLASIVMACALTIMAFGQRRDLLAWALGMLLQGVAFAFLGLRGHIPDLLSILLSNLAFVGAATMYTVALYRFQHRPVPRWVMVVPLTVMAAGSLLMLGSYQGRTLLISALQAAQFTHMVVLIARGHQRTAGRGQYIVAFSTTLIALAMAVRVMAILTGSEKSQEINEATATASVLFAVALLSTLLTSIGVLMMAAERAEQELSESEARHRKLIESANEGICVLEGDALRFANPKFLEMSGYTAEEVLNQPFMAHIHPEDRPRVLENYQRRLEGDGEGQRYPARMITKKRGPRWFEISGVSIEWRGAPATLNFVTDITERRMMDERIRDLAYHDTLTHLPNRRLFLDHLQLAMGNNQRSKKHSAVVFMDLDNFKPLNDEHGHNVGDLLLIEVALRLRHAIRSVDTPARFGGDEFVVLLNDLSADAAEAAQQAEQVATKLIQALGEPYQLKAEHAGIVVDVEHHCTASAGVAVFSGKDIAPDALLDRADAAMYHAKETGRNRVCFFAAGLVKPA